jgi:hypothetical protein
MNPQKKRVFLKAFSQNALASERKSEVFANIFTEKPVFLADLSPQKDYHLPFFSSIIQLLNCFNANRPECIEYRELRKESKKHWRYSPIRA